MGQGATALRGGMERPGAGAKKGPEGALAITRGHWGASPTARGAPLLLGGGGAPHPYVFEVGMLG